MEPQPYLSSSPHLHAAQDTARIMRSVALSLLPACAAAVYFFGLSALGVLLLATLGCLAVEVLCQRLMGRPHSLADGSALRESTTTAGGHRPVVVKTPLAAIGLSICYDLRFPELYTALRCPHLPRDPPSRAL